MQCTAVDTDPTTTPSRIMKLCILLMVVFPDAESRQCTDLSCLDAVPPILASAPVRAEEPVSRRCETHYGARSFVANEPVKLSKSKA